jgi:hypothetical protein
MPGTAAHPVRCLPVILRALADLEEELAGDTGDPALAGVARPLNVNAGTVLTGDWASSAPARARGRQRVRS